MQNNAKPNKPITNADAPLPSPVVPRPSKRVDGQTLVLCICQVPEPERYTMRTMTNREKPESPWMPNEACACGGTGWVCVGCGSHKWGLDLKTHRAVPCARCSETISGRVTFQPWMEKFRNQKAAPAGNVAAYPAALPSRADLDAERQRREAERAQTVSQWDDDWESERVYEEELQPA